MPYKTYQEGSRRSTRAAKEEPVIEFFLVVYLLGVVLSIHRLLTVDTSLCKSENKMLPCQNVADCYSFNFASNFIMERSCNTAPHVFKAVISLSIT